MLAGARARGDARNPVLRVPRRRAPPPAPHWVPPPAWLVVQGPRKNESDPELRRTVPSTRAELENVPEARAAGAAVPAPTKDSTNKNRRFLQFLMKSLEIH